MDYELIEPDQTHDAGAFISYARARRTDKQERDADVGDIVHFWDGECCSAALVLRDQWDSVCLSVVRPKAEGGTLEYGHVPHSEGKLHETWHWPCGGH